MHLLSSAILSNLLSDGIGDALGIRSEASAFVPSHPLEHLEAEVVVGQLVFGVVGLVEILAALHRLELNDFEIYYLKRTRD